MSVVREAGENYLEAILEIEQSSDLPGVRSVDVAKKLNVSRPSVNKAIGILREAGMVEQQPYGYITLTTTGRNRALEVSRRHKLIKRFLTEILKVDDLIAETEACKMEHIMSDITMASLADYLEKVL